MLGKKTKVVTPSNGGKTENKRSFQASGGDTGAGGLVASLQCTAYFGKLAVLFGCSSKRRPSPFVLVSQPSLTRLRAYLARITRVH